ncbi:MULTISPECIES: TRAP transporter small permease [Pseudomonas syringae group]|uniref:TRAP transporter small permease protein n=1 Tax=Pseudomonas syringae pv. primulae TaxID=251707 RepID=A0A0P9XI97_9PSED|nr:MULTISPECIES: TRAP transporter small permease [Pseudomonas syringae group]MCF9016902.1 TRAP transporter small permease subunit [Pseudomonas syringae]KPY31788.1 Tripartite ATP-independent periplasmic transporter DctQ [Pseudomonas syringae pv. primulae]MBD8202435.1 TRAP transporter small permease [Pseudomonas viridiflava]MBI6703974.1 TRAP transporter small permease [Pseudomonas viridiflava]MBI6726928.1 TRAP transporter small permease [Pseudomonas viridiflava]
MKNTLLRINDTLYRVCIGIAGLSVLIMTLIIPWGIFARYVLGSGSSWPEPVAILLMVVFTFFGAAASYRAGAHMAVAMAVDRMPLQVRKVAAVIVQILMAIVALFMIVKGFKLCATTWNQFLGEIPSLRVGISYLPIPIGGIVTLIFVLERMFLGDQSHRSVMRFDVIEESEGAA